MAGSKAVPKAAWWVAGSAVRWVDWKAAKMAGGSAAQRAALLVAR